MSQRDQYWREHYEKVFRNGAAWLDYSNERVQAQTFAIALFGAGAVEGRRCLDVGCGHGQFTSLLHAMRAEVVTGIDIVAEMIGHNRAREPEIDWRVGSLSDRELHSSLGDFDLIFLLEVLQYVDVQAALASAWSCLRPGGRLVGVVPNGSCPMVERTRDRFDAHYDPPTAGQIATRLASLPERHASAVAGMHFQADQRIAPYAVTDWVEQPTWKEPPNRLAFVAIRAGAEAESA